MSTDVALQAMFERFVARFVLPLAKGGDSLLVSYPLGLGAAEYFVNAQVIDTAVEEELQEARRETTRRIVALPPLLRLEGEEIRLLLALHNVLLGTHPELAGGLRGGSRWEHCLGWAREHLRKVSPCAGADRAVARHSLLHLVPELRRQDSIVRTKRSSKRYAGQEPPRLALIWPRLRQVETSLAKAPLAEVVPQAEAQELLTEVLERSPLTCLLTMPYGKRDSIHREELRWSPSVVSVLARPDVCRAVTYRHLELGLHVVGAPLAKSVVLGLERLLTSPNEGERERLSFGLRYVLNLHVTHLWTARGDELLAPFERKWNPEDEVLRGLFFGWLAAALSREDRLGAPAPPDGDARRQESRYRQEAVRAAGGQLDDAAKHIDWIVPHGKPLELNEGGPS